MLLLEFLLAICYDVLVFYCLPSSPWRHLRRPVPLAAVLEPVGHLGHGEAGLLGQGPFLIGRRVPVHLETRKAAKISSIWSSVCRFKLFVQHLISNLLYTAGQAS